MILEQWIVVGAESLWPSVASGSIIEHTADSRAIYVSSMDSEPDYPACVLIHHDHDPVRP